MKAIRNLCNLKLCWTCHSVRELSGWILRFPVGKDRLRADALPKTLHVLQQPMGFIWLDWKKRREGIPRLWTRLLGRHI